MESHASLQAKLVPRTQRSDGVPGTGQGAGDPGAPRGSLGEAVSGPAEAPLSAAQSKGQDDLWLQKTVLWAPQAGLPSALRAGPVGATSARMWDDRVARKGSAPGAALANCDLKQ